MNMGRRIKAAYRAFTAPWRQAAQRGGYEGARITNYMDFATRLEAAHKERMRDLGALRAHSRDLAKNNAYMKSYRDLCVTNIIGPDGIDFENNLIDLHGKPQDGINDIVEAAHEDWKRAVTADGQSSWFDFEQLVTASLAVDGEAFVHLLRGHGAHGLLLELIDPDRIDHNLNTALNNGRRIIMGIEVDEKFKPLAYYVRTAHPTDPQGVTPGKPYITRVPADEILHVYLDDRTNGVRGIPWASACMVHLDMLHRLWTSALAAANAESDRLGIIKGAPNLNGEELREIGQDDKGNPLFTPASVAKTITSEMASYSGIPLGLDVEFPPPQHPNPVLGDFTKFLLKGIAAGLQVSYHSLAGDVAEANYSSLRASLLTERDSWRKIQHSIIGKFHEKITKIFVEMSWLSGKIAIDAPPDEFYRPIWWPRSWDWVDPQKDVQAEVIALKNRITNYQRILGKRGLDWREEFKQMVIEEKFAEEIGLDLTPEMTLALLSKTPTGGPK